MKYIPKYLSTEIKDKINYIYKQGSNGREFRRKIGSKGYFLCEKLKRESIEKNAQINSFKIEYPGEIINPRRFKNGQRKMLKEGIRNIANAFRWGQNNFDPNNFKEEFIRHLAGFIVPEICNGKIASYRKDIQGTGFDGFYRVTPPDPFKVTSIEIPKFIKELKYKFNNDNGPIARIVSSIYSHLHLVRIHPFVDGNGRTSRVLQDIILKHYNIPIPIIESGERSTYYKLIESAIFDWKHLKNSGEINNGATDGEQGFYTFMAGKVNVSLDKIIDACYR